ncbi:DUF3034 family protein [Curvibacter lanceolatus]|jgi:hypothetical protein|uniref:DUF3034 family protein n=1 Tax=Curvibacter lanceolatus TaxID=86182 RepID=UPI000371915E
MTMPKPRACLNAPVGLSVALFLSLGVHGAHAESGKLLLTGGVSTVEGAAGGGIVPWAVIGTQATDGEIGLSANFNHLATHDYGLKTYALTLNLRNQLELSVGQQDLSAGPATALNALGFDVQPGPHLKMDVLGAKLRLAGDAILDSDTLMPQVAVGLQHKHTQAASLQPVFNFLGVRNSGTDVYVSATKLWLAQGLLLNATLRYTQANQGGLLGFGSAAPGRHSASLNPELSVAYLLRKDLAVGAEYRFMPNNLEAVGRAAGLGNALRQDDWKDLFVAWAPQRNVSLTAAYVDLGRIVPGVTEQRRQRGWYLSGQVSF